MKSFLVITLFFISFTTFSQNNHIVKTKDGRDVLLKKDFTWEYILVDSTSITFNELKEKKDCNLASSFEEPKLNAKIQNQLKKGRATINHIKKKVAKDYNCTVEDVLLVTASEKKEKGSYTFCAKGQNVTYKRIGNTIIKKGKLF